MKILPATAFSPFKERLQETISNMRLGACINAILAPGEICELMQREKPDPCIIDAGCFNRVQELPGGEDSFRESRVVVVAGENGGRELGEAIRNGADDYISCSCSRREMENRLRVNAQNILLKGIWGIWR